MSQLGAAEPDAAGLVLAGGQSSRMGRDKALLPWGSGTLVEHALGILREAGLSASIAGARAAELSAFAPVVPDSEPNQGPLGGICSALAFTQAQWAVFVPVDMPLLPASLLAYMLYHARTTEQVVTLASVSGYTHTFPAVLSRVALSMLLHVFHAGSGGCFAAFCAAAEALGQPVAVLPVELLAQAGQVEHPAALPPVRWFLNVNSPADLRQARMQRTALLA